MLNASDWSKIAGVFQPIANDGSEERLQVARAVALIESVVSAQAGTADDQPQYKGAFRNTRQLDCVAESANTTAMLMLLQDEGLLRLHTIRYPRHRGFIQGLFPHNTAVIQEISSGDRYAVDSFYHASGMRPEIVPLQQWLAGFKLNS